MKKELIALGAALALVGTLTACSSTPADQNKGGAGSGATGSTTGSAGTWSEWEKAWLTGPGTW